MSNFLLAQGKFLESENLADSLYYNKSDYYKEKEYRKLQHLRNQLLVKHQDTSTIDYKIALSKKYAADALLQHYSMKYDTAIVLSKKAIDVVSNLKKQDLFYKGHLNKYLYQQYKSISDWDRALLHAKKVKTIFRDTLQYNHKLLSDAEFDLGYVLGQFGDYSKVIYQYKKAIDLVISNKGEYTITAAIQEHHLALVYGFIGYYKLELESYLKVVKRWEAIESPDQDMSYLNIAYGSLSTWYLLHGDYVTAEQYLIKSENLIKRHKTTTKKWFNETFRGRTKVISWKNYANLFLHKGDTINALKNNSEILNFIDRFDFNDQQNNPHNLPHYKKFVVLNKIKALQFRATVLKDKNLEKAKDLFEEALLLETKNDVSTTTMNIKLNLIDLYMADKNYEAVDRKLKTWLFESKERKTNYLYMFLLAEKANVAIKRNDTALMHKMYKLVFKKSLKDTLHTVALDKLTHTDCKPYSDHNFVDLVLEASRNYKKAFIKSKNNEYLKISHNLSRFCSEIFSKSYVFSEYNDNLHEKVTQINDQLLSTSLMLGKRVNLNDILQQIEESSSRLSWSKFLRSKERKYINIPDSILEKENNLKRELHFYKKSLFISKTNDIEKDKLFKDKIFDIEEELLILDKYLKENYTSYFNQTQKDFDIQFLKQTLKRKQTLIKYIFTSQDVYAFIINNKTTKLIRISSIYKLNRQIKFLIQTLSKPNTNYKEFAINLHTSLIPESVVDLVKNQDIIFILDDILHFVPMEVLIDAKGKYLIQNHNISYVPSLLLWDEQLKVKKSRRNKLGIFAPTYKDYYKENSKRNDSTALLGAFAEAMDIAKIFKSDIYSGSKASKDAFLNKANNYNVLHLAMHSTLNNKNSEFSSLSFSPDEEDNKLFISELYTISLNADLAVLSACNTGSGTLKKGEGLMNVSRAFTYAGVPSTVTSLWSVPDKETSQVMVSFYKHLKKGESKNSAMRLAKLEYLKTTEDLLLKHPYYWAGFIVSGEVSPIINPFSVWIYIFAVLIFLCFIFRKKLIKLFK